MNRIGFYCAVTVLGAMSSVPAVRAAEGAPSAPAAVTAEGVPFAPATVTAEASSSVPAEAAVVETAPPAPPSKGILEVNTLPQGATVSLGGSSPEFQQTLGKTPFRTEIEPGSFSLIIELAGFETVAAEVDVQPGKTALMQVKLEEETMRTHRGLRIAGHLLFWPGLVTAGTGIALIAADDPEKNVNTGMPGYITAGIGVAMTAAGGIILGLTSRNRDVYTMPTVSVMTVPDGTGGGMMIQKRF